MHTAAADLQSLREQAPELLGELGLPAGGAARAPAPEPAPAPARSAAEEAVARASEEAIASVMAKRKTAREEGARAWVDQKLEQAMRAGEEGAVRAEVQVVDTSG